MMGEIRICEVGLSVRDIAIEWILEALIIGITVFLSPELRVVVGIAAGNSLYSPSWTMIKYFEMFGHSFFAYIFI